MFSFKKKLDAKEILFPLNKHLLSSIYELRETTLDDSRRPNQSVDTVFDESAALVYFLVCSPVKLAKLPSSVETLLLSALKGMVIAHLPGREKDDAQQFIENRFDAYYSDIEGGYNEAEICSKYLDFIGVIDHGNEIIQNFSYTSFIDTLFMDSMIIMANAKKNFKVIYRPLSKDDWALMSAQVKQALSEHKKSK